MYEIEMKFKLENDNFDDVLKLFMIDEKIKQQNDFVYIPKSQVGLDTKPGDRIYRIREQTSDGKKINLLTLKVEGKQRLMSKEIEFEVSSGESARDFLEESGLELTVNINKKRAEFEKDGYTFCIDEVEKLGVFIELEKLTSDNNGLNIQKEMMKYLNDLNIKGSICDIPYDTQIENLKM